MPFASSSLLSSVLETLIILTHLLLLLALSVAFFPHSWNIRNWHLKWVVFFIGLTFTELALPFVVLDWILVIVTGSQWLRLYNVALPFGHSVDGFLPRVAGLVVTAFCSMMLAGVLYNFITAWTVVCKEMEKAAWSSRGKLTLGVLGEAVFTSLIPIWRPLGLSVNKDITYLTPEELKQMQLTDEEQLMVQLDVIRQEKPTSKPRPIFMYIHGGAWSMGDKRQITSPICWHMANRHNFVVVNVNYRLSTRKGPRGGAVRPAKYPDHLIDCKRALRWIRLNAHKYGGDPDFVAVSGNSAGGHLAAMLALTQNVETFQPGYNHADFPSWFSAAICGRTSYDEHWLKVRACPMSLVPSIRAFSGSDSSLKMADNGVDQRSESPIPPFLIFHGANDNIVPHTTVRHFTKRLAQYFASPFSAAAAPGPATDSDPRHNKAIPPVMYFEFPYAHHAFDIFNNPRAVLVSYVAGQYLSAAYDEWTKSHQTQ
ncbi:hypothetical protein PhCBS80983_g06124 [Powellomyces hirtus]|uniref:BD-FAE-like domain-containing protein n=1 Tax=Powellomyces hirtus TaxID=109895 RepID=A0A507DRI1_9FUNG|nr:hypothetical protein PhCBS80983_g06124 [Powellomyces hirtus]